MTTTNTAGGRAACVLFLALIQVLGVAAVPVLAASTGAVQDERQQTAAEEAALGLDRASRRVLQQRLAAVGFDAGAPDGMFGPTTRAAIRAWQASHGLSTTGYLDAAQAEALRTGAPPRLAAATAPGGSQQNAETVFWQSVENSTNPAEFEAYLAQWPEGVYAPLARIRLATLRDAAAGLAGPGSGASRSDSPTAARGAGDVFRDCDGCPEMVVIPAGSFMMGSPASEEGRRDGEGPQHRVTLRSFALGATEVTFDEWEACVRGGGCNGYRPGDQGWGRGSRPVIMVSWEDAQAYASWLSAETGAAYRLPSESEWEYAARAGTTTPFHTGATISTDQANYHGGYTYGSGRPGTYRRRTTPVGTFAPNAFGLYDVHGNVFEWVEDCWHSDYAGAPNDETAWTSGGRCSHRVLRGGSWDNLPRLLRSAARSRRLTAGTRSNGAGFRVARTLD